MKISSLTLETDWKTVHMKKTKVGFNQECPESHSYAFDWVNCFIHSEILLTLYRTAVSNYNYLNRAENAVKLSVRGTSLLMVLETGYVDIMTTEI